MIKIENKELNSYKSKLKRLRVSSGMTQDDLSQLSGINIKSISAYEQDPVKINKASVDTLYILAESLNCNIEDLVETELIKKENYKV